MLSGIVNKALIFVFILQVFYLLGEFHNITSHVTVQENIFQKSILLITLINVYTELRFNQRKVLLF